MSDPGVGVATSLRDLVVAGELFESLPLPLLLSNAEGTDVWSNAAARELSGWLGEGDPAHTLQKELSRTLQALPSAPTELPLTLHRRDGATRTYALSLQHQRTESPHGGVYLIALSEIDGRQAAADARSEIAQARIEDIQRQLLQADRMASIGQLAAGVAHEINNPIGYIQSNLGTLREYAQSLLRLIETQDTALNRMRHDHPDLMRQIEDMREQIDFEFLAKDLPTLLTESQEGIARVRKIIQDLRDFSRAGHSEAWTMADIHAGLDSTINIVWNDLKYKVELFKRYGELPQIECLPSQLNQVFLNILVNAGHAIEQRGQITIATRADENQIFVEISDTGKGIPEEHLARVFEPFFTTKPIGKGTGLGLSISYGIIQKHHGAIDVRSEVGVGTTFLIKLPLRQPPGTTADKTQGA